MSDTTEPKRTEAIKLTPVLWTERLEESLAFYRDILGFEIADYRKEWQWALIRSGTVEIMMSAPNAHENFSGARLSGSLYIEVADCDAVWTRIDGRANVVYEPETFKWGMREFAVRDCNGYILQFGHRV